MSKNIKPLDDSSTTPQSLPNRSALSELYGKPLKSIQKPLRANATSDKATNAKSDLNVDKSPWKLVIIANFLLAPPLIISYLSISKIYTLVGPNNVFDAASNQLLMTLLTISTFVPWIVSLRYLSKLVNSYNANLTALLVLYCFFAFPVLDIIISLRSHMSIWVVLPLVVVLSQVYSQIMINALLSSKTGFPRYRLLLIAILLACSVAIAI